MISRKDQDIQAATELFQQRGRILADRFARVETSDRTHRIPYQASPGVQRWVYVRLEWHAGYGYGFLVEGRHGTFKRASLARTNAERLVQIVWGVIGDDQVYYARVAREEDAKASLDAEARAELGFAPKDVWRGPVQIRYERRPDGIRYSLQLTVEDLSAAQVLNLLASVEMTPEQDAL